MKRIGIQGGSGLSDRRRAFTLLELLVAIALFSFVVLAIYSSWISIVRGSKVGLDAAAEAQRARMAIRTVEQALANVQLHVDNADLYAFIADTSNTDFAALTFASRLPASFPGSGLFGEQNLRRVSFTVEAGPDGGNELVLRQESLLYASMDDPYPIVLARDVVLFGIEFWDERAGEWALEFTATNEFPRLMRVLLVTSATGKALSGEVQSRVIAPPSRPIPREAQAGRGITGSSGSNQNRNGGRNDSGNNNDGRDANPSNP